MKPFHFALLLCLGEIGVMLELSRPIGRLFPVAETLRKFRAAAVALATNYGRAAKLYKRAWSELNASLPQSVVRACGISDVFAHAVAFTLAGQVEGGIRLSVYEPGSKPPLAADAITQDNLDVCFCFLEKRGIPQSELEDLHARLRADYSQATSGRDGPADAKRAEPAARSKRKPRIAKDEANVRAREAMKGRPPKGKKRWSQRTLAKAIGCSAGLVQDLPVWQAYAEDHGLKRDKRQAAPKALSLTNETLAKEDSAAASERLRLAELEKAAAEQIAEGEADRKQYRRRRKV